MKRARPEQAIQKAVLQHLKLRGARNLFAFHCPNGGARTAIEGAIFKSLGVVAGVPDLLIISDGKTFALELKADSGRVTPAQADVHQRMRAAGAIVGIARGIDEGLRWLESNGLLRGRVSA